MLRSSWIFLIFVGIAGPSAAQTSQPLPRFDAAATVGLIEARPGEVDQPYYQDWYTQGRYAASIGYYFTKNLKAEFEHAWSGEGSRLLFEYQQVGGLPYPYQVEQYFQLQQSTLRLVWQFRDNAWVHPYVSAGAVLDTEHQRYHIPLTYQPGARGEHVLVRTEMNSGDRYELRPGFSIAGGAKFYLSQRAFFNTGAIVTHSPPSSTVNFIAGFGVDF
jgi:hypothetical protein